MRHLYYIDNLRALLMTMGVVLHASVAADFWFSDAVGYLSSIFRMKTFFFVSGFFMALSSVKQSNAELVMNRIVRIGVPAVFIIVTLNPVTNWLLYNLVVGDLALRDMWSLYDGRAADVPDYLNWHLHVWFLLVLLVFSIGFHWFNAACRSKPVGWAVSWFSVEARPVWVRLGTLSLALATASLAGRTLHFLTFQQVLHGTSFNFPVQALLWYPPYFLLGLVAFQNPKFFKLLRQTSIPLSVAAGLLLWSVEVQYAWLEGLSGEKVAQMVRHLATGLAGFFVFNGLLALFSLKLDLSNTTMRFLVRASYTVYLLHMLMLAAVFYLFKDVLPVPSITLYLVGIVTSYILCLAVHHLVVERNSIAAFLLNGVPLTPVGLHK